VWVIGRTLVPFPAAKIMAFMAVSLQLWAAYQLPLGGLQLPGRQGS